MSVPFQKREIYIFVLCNLPGKEQLAHQKKDNHLSNYARGELLFPGIVMSSPMPFVTHVVSHGTYTAAAASGASVMGSSYKKCIPR